MMKSQLRTKYRTRPEKQSVLRRYRWTELSLFILPALILLLIMTQLFIANNVIEHIDPRSAYNPKILPTVQGLIPALGLIVAFFVMHILLTIFFPKADQFLLPLVSLLSGIGVMMVTRIGRDQGFDLGSKQLVWVLLGLIACGLTMIALRYLPRFSRYKYTWIVLSFIALAPAVIKSIMDSDAGPARDALRFGPFNLQPSEFAKITIVIFFAAYLSENREIIAKGYMKLGRLHLPPLRHLGPLVMMLGLALLIFLMVHDLGLALLIYCTFLCLMYLASGRLLYTVVSLLLFVGMAIISYNLFGYVQNRFRTVTFDIVHWQNWTPAQQYYAENQGQQILQAVMAIASGGLLGSGIGLGHPTYVPVVESDMIFTGIGEEIGLIGLFALICLYALIMYRGFRIAITARDPFMQLLAGGLTSIFAIQTLVITLGNIKLLPLTGIPLPFLSYGGSSILANYIIIGILLRISHDTEMEKETVY
ncbi:cell elongation-specific peptidoglycan biosynthesis regulator RodA [Thermosporothrix hazakensis]|jgi:cell division protein FtsW (lipid II flippase)|uniref:Cell elongation-specific peptidoglycan biosynthesis regulator RodA n=2 Tax=Thermosporothrix TaxID=768650 RepID=A0A326UEX4_THEHA|nr:FtsW/RodA/SpoVE family cell cycle protein [Thermosporothrix hazakensis]PZW36421.1 cell elongation-specific peptidoglycan biosynthesis regulator RodA [Thermosporothrix hazakensis]BBH88888.1 cell cycle protein [Thermosporothrix sp. COM3]GCE47073.1 cell cycle protein [Thermosporothrix hazakensis]